MWNIGKHIASAAELKLGMKYWDSVSVAATLDGKHQNSKWNHSVFEGLVKLSSQHLEAKGEMPRKHMTPTQAI